MSLPATEVEAPSRTFYNRTYTHKCDTGQFHQWRINGPNAGLLYHVKYVDGYFDPRIHLEYRLKEAVKPDNDLPPDDDKCWLVKEPCWIVSDQEQADNLFPIFEDAIQYGNHMPAFEALERVYRQEVEEL